MRLSHKYQIDGWLQMMKMKLQDDWPLKYTDYRARLTFVGSPGYRIPQAAKLIDAAQRCQANELLPAAFYELASAWGTHLEEIVKVLSPENIARLCVGHTRVKERLKALAAGSADMLMWKVSPTTSIFQHRPKFALRSLATSQVPVYCQNTLSAFQSVLTKRTYEGTFELTIIQELDRCDLTGPCNSCVDWFMDVLKNKAEEIWECIPADFDLPRIDPKL